MNLKKGLDSVGKWVRGYCFKHKKYPTRVGRHATMCEDCWEEIISKAMNK